MKKTGFVLGTLIVGMVFGLVVSASLTLAGCASTGETKESAAAAKQLASE